MRRANLDPSPRRCWLNKRVGVSLSAALLTVALCTAAAGQQGGGAGGASGSVTLASTTTTSPTPITASTGVLGLHGNSPPTARASSGNPGSGPFARTGATIAVEVAAALALVVAGGVVTRARRGR